MVEWSLSEPALSSPVRPSVVTGNLRGTLIPALGSVPFTAVLTLDVSSQQGNVRTTFADPRGPVTIQVYFSKVGDVYVLTRVIVS
jgi:hypothetical protein